MNLADLVAKMVSDVKKGKVKPAPKKKKLPGASRTGVALKPEDIRYTPIQNPFIDEALVLIVNTYECECGAQHKFPNPRLLLSKTRIHRGLPESILESVPVNNMRGVFKHLPTRILNRHHMVETCQECFTADSNTFYANQFDLPLEFPQEPQHEN
jgi:hypothetical protein